MDGARATPPEPIPAWRMSAPRDVVTRIGVMQPLWQWTPL